MIQVDDQQDIQQNLTAHEAEQPTVLPTQEDIADLVKELDLIDENLNQLNNSEV